MIELRNVTKEYGEISAIEDVNLKVAKGEIFTLIGPNGSGKTTVLRIMAGIDSPTRGEMYFKNNRVYQANLHEVRRNTTLVFQRTALFNMTVQKNVSYGLKLRSYSREEIEERVCEALKIVKLQGYEKRWAKKLSGGEQQRVSLARGLALQTDALLLDEPTANLDPKSVSIIEETIAWISRERKTTVVMATHNMFQAESLTNKAALIIGGKIVQTGTAQEIFNTPSEHLNSFSRLENVFTGTSSILEGGTSVVNIEDGVQIEAAVRREGRVTILVRPEDIILSEERIVSSARNSFRGEVSGISDLGDIVRLKIDAGRGFTVQITRRSFVEMGLNIGSKVFLNFKASSVSIIS